MLAPALFPLLVHLQKSLGDLDPPQDRLMSKKRIGLLTSGETEVFLGSLRSKTLWTSCRKIVTIEMWPLSLVSRVLVESW